MYCPACSPRASDQCVIIFDFAEAPPKRLVHPEARQYKRPSPHSGNKLSPAPCASTSPSALPSASRVDTLRLRPRFPFPLSAAALSLLRVLRAQLGFCRVDAWFSGDLEGRPCRVCLSLLHTAPSPAAGGLWRHAFWPVAWIYPTAIACCRRFGRRWRTARA